MDIKFKKVAQKLLMVTLLTTMTLNAKVCKDTNRDGSTVTYTTTSNTCNYYNVTGKQITKYKNGKVESEITYKNDIKEGISKFFFKMGILVLFKIILMVRLLEQVKVIIIMVNYMKKQFLVKRVFLLKDKYIFKMVI